MKGSINSIESCGTVDGPGIRCVVFLNKCLLRCKFCHNPETWNMQGLNYTTDELVEKIKRFKPYFKRNNGGVTISGGEPLLQHDFLLELCKKLHEEDVHIALDTAGYSDSDYIDILKNVDLILFDIKDITEERYKSLTGGNINKSLEFIKNCNYLKKKMWIRMVIVPGVHDNKEYLNDLCDYIVKNFDCSNVERIDFLPYHKMGEEKYIKLGLTIPYKDIEAMDVNKCKELHEYFMNMYNERIKG